MKYCEKCGAAFRYARTCPRDNVKLVAGAFDPLLGRVLGDRYRLLDRIGAGGMGQVYRAAHSRIACVFAVKVVWGDFAYDKAMQQRFVREAEVASCLQSRHIVRVIDFAQDAGSLPYLVMEHLDGPTLSDVIAREGPLPAERAGRIALRIARGLAHAHERGVVHRDLKPENIILVDEEDERDIVKILDFGVARLRDNEKLTGFGVTVGTPIYMAPEQHAGSNVDGRADLYALGIVLFEMLTGEPPFSADNLGELTRLHFQQPPPSIRARISTNEESIAVGLDDVIRRLLAKNPADRFQSARELIEEISSTLEPVDPMSAASARRSPVDPSIIVQIGRAISQGAPRYNENDHAGCYAIYREAAQQMLSSGTVPYVAVSARLLVGLRSAAARGNATSSAWDMRYAFDDIVAAKPIAVTGDALADELAAFASLAHTRESEGRFDVVGDFQMQFARALAARFASDPARAQVAQALDDAARRAHEAGGGQAAVTIIDPLLARLRLRGAAAAAQAVSSIRAPQISRISATTISEDIRQVLTRAIRQGAPAYDQGRPDVCARIYQQTAQEIVQRSASAEDPVSKLLQKTIEEAGKRPPEEAAWVYRLAFDNVLASK